MADKELWRQRAICATETFKQAARNAGADRDTSQIFFPIEADEFARPFKPGVHKAKKWQEQADRFRQLAFRACGVCPVRLDCLWYGMEHEQEPYGIYGGLTAEARCDLLDSSEAKLVTRKCPCGTPLHGTKKTLLKYCSPGCKELSND